MSFIDKVVTTVVFTVVLVTISALYYKYIVVPQNTIEEQSKVIENLKDVETDLAISVSNEEVYKEEIEFMIIKNEIEERVDNVASEEDINFTIGKHRITL